MEKGFIDRDNIYTIEAYIGYGKKTDLHKMTLTQLQDELKMSDKLINRAQEEVNGADGYPSYALKEKLENAKYYKRQVEKRIDQLTQLEMKQGGIDGMIADLDRQLKEGTITKEYHDQYVEKLNNKRELYDENIKKSVENDDKEEDKRRKKKKHIFRRFKDKLSDYKKK